MRAVRFAAVASLAALAGCSAPADLEELDQSQSPLAAVCEANVKGVGLVSTEDKYLANVVHCENGGAPFEALKAQAIAARTYLYYKMETSGSIADGTGDQVYSCGSGPTAEQIKAVKDTAGQVLRYSGVTICAFYVAGGAASPPECKGSSTAATEKYVTYNDGKSGGAVTQTTLGFVSPTNYRNRGCFSQLGSRCLSNAGKTAEQILRFYYGADIVIETAVGACVPTAPPDAGADTAKPPADTAVADTAVADTTVNDAAEGDATPADDAAAEDAGATGADANDAGTTSANDRFNDEITGSCGCSTPGGRSSGGEALALLGVAALAQLVRSRRAPR